MSNYIQPCIWFKDNGRAAADYYISLFDNSSICLDNGMVVIFQLAGQTFMTMNGNPNFQPGAAISFFVISESDEEIDFLWNKLLDGGFAMMPLDKYDWSERYGFLTDKFGIAWQIMKGDFNSVGQKISPCLLYVNESYGKAEASVHFYNQVFTPASIDGILLYNENEAPMTGKVKHSQFRLLDHVFMAMDGAGNHSFHFNEAISFVIHCQTQAEIDAYWNALSADGGKELMCGWVTDKFGVSWQVIPENIGQIMQDPDSGPRAMQALLKMKKIDIEGLLNA